ncbi:hypothetical protein L6452_43141 [Arctium lappa]|uniref:Uncharacterized protein n=1 Tax=Arctium lappa TaxID=4217 RepID=A0ACB8XK53_ARCLA|nr:hypothetical protein L6452_43141 [Arctium lappa]
MGYGSRSSLNELDLQALVVGGESLATLQVTFAELHQSRQHSYNNVNGRVLDSTEPFCWADCEGEFAIWD